MYSVIKINHKYKYHCQLVYAQFTHFMCCDQTIMLIIIYNLWSQIHNIIYYVVESLHAKSLNLLKQFVIIYIYIYIKITNHKMHHFMIKIKSYLQIYKWKRLQKQSWILTLKHSRKQFVSTNSWKSNPRGQKQIGVMTYFQLNLFFTLFFYLKL